jgi:DNA-binding NtrC family response regulator
LKSLDEAPVDGATALALIDRLLKSELEPAKLLGVTLGLALEAVRAERGFVVALDGDAPEALVARNLDVIIASSRVDFSRTLARRARSTGAPVAVDGGACGLETAADLAGRVVLVAPAGDVVIYVDRPRTAGPFSPDEIDLMRDVAARARPLLSTALKLRRREAELARTRETLARTLRDMRLKHDFTRIVGASEPMARTLGLVARAAAAREPVFFVGESGTGKELLARALHFNGPRSGGPFVAVNCAALPESLAESELFGHVKGAFTGADDDRAGLFEQADGGTLFLDEVGSTPALVQAKLLRALQTGEIHKIGASQPTRVDVRVVSATHEDPRTRLRSDLLFRLDVVRIAVPPLRERAGDLPLLVDHVARRIAEQYGWPSVTVDEAAMAALARHRFPGNVRELENVLRRACALSGGGQIGLEHLPVDLLEDGRPVNGAELMRRRKLAAVRAMEEVDRAFVEDALRRSHGNVAQAARETGVGRTFFYKLLGELGIDPDVYK